MPRRDQLFETITTEGALLPSDFLQRLAQRDRDIAGLTADDYHLGGGERLNEAISRSWNRLLGVWKNFSGAATALSPTDAGTTLTREKWLLPLFQELGYGRVPTAKPFEFADRKYSISHLWQNTPIHLVSFRADLDERSENIVGARKSTPHSMVQEFLNRSDAHLWGVVANGYKLRLLRDNSSFIRQAYVEFDLQAMMTGEVYADFALLWLLLHQSRVEGERPELCWLEKWTQEARQQGERALDHMREGVQDAITALGQGFLAHPANAALRDRLRSGELTTLDYFRQLLRVVYRFLFLCIAEDRDLLHPTDVPAKTRENYRRHYSLTRLRRMAQRLGGTQHSDLWHIVQLIVRSLGSKGGCPALGLPALGSFLWSERATPALDGCQLSNRQLLQAIRSLAFSQQGRFRRPVDYKNIGSPEFGSVYESLLEQHPKLNLDAATFTLDTHAGNERKTTGSHYTPPPLVNCLLDSALEPVLEETIRRALAGESEQVRKSESGKTPAAPSGSHSPTFSLSHLPANAEARARAESAILNLKVCDKACGSGHFLVAAAHRIAKRLASIRTGEEEPAPAALRHALRDVIGRCLYGVDINPMAVELCKFALWLEALEPGKPLSFLDHHIRCGNSLLGATPELIKGGIPDAAFDAIEGDNKDACSALRNRNKRENPKLGEWFIADEAVIRDKLFKAAAAINEIGDNQLEEIERKEAAFRNAQTNYDFQKAWDLADLWCAAFVIKKHFPASAAADSLSASTGERAGVRCRSDSEPSLDAQPLATQGGLFGGTEELPKAKGKKVKATSRADSENAIGITTQHLRDYVAGGSLPDGLLAEAKRLAGQYQFFHWHLAFPEVFQIPPAGQNPENQLCGWNGGFDVILGNPPWERVKLQEKEWFTAHGRDDIANAPNASMRKKLIKELLTNDARLYSSFRDDLRAADGESHLLRNSGCFPLCGRGDINTFAVFTEGMRNGLATRGRIGCIVPSGIATDETKKHFVQDLITTRTLSTLYQFLNKGFFAGVRDAQGNRFCLLTLTGVETPVEHPDFVFSAWRIADLGDSERHFSLTAEDIALLNPNTCTLPIFQSRKDAEITKGIYRRVPVLIQDGPPEQNPWGVSFSRMLDMANDSDLFRSREQLQAADSRHGNIIVEGDAQWLPLYEAKMIHHYNHRFGDYALAQITEKEVRQLPQAGVECLSNPEYAVMPRYWVGQGDVEARLRERQRQLWLLGWRDICSSVDVRTVIACFVPRVAVNDKFLLMFTSRSPLETACLLGCLSSFALDYCARQKLGGTSLKYFVMKQLPVLLPETYAKPCAWAVQGQTLQAWLLPRVLELTYTAWDLEAFAQDCGWSGPPFRWDEERRFLLRCELDAAFFHLYGLSRDDAAYILDTFPIVRRKDEARTEETNAAGEVIKPGRYITKDTILEIYDALAEAQRTGQPYATRLNPPPADPRCCHPAKQAAIPIPTWMDRPLVLPAIRRVALTPDRYRAALVPHLLYQSGGSLPFERFRKAYWLLTEPKTLGRYATGAVGEVAQQWSRQFRDTLQKDMFIQHLKGAVGRQLHFVRKDGERWLELRDPNVADDEHVVFDARLALLVADLWPVTEPIAPLAAADETAIQQLEAVL